MTSKTGDAQEFTHRAIEKGYDAIAVYGGDGTIMEAARSLANSDIPLYILPGGTANIMAKELQIPLFLESALRLLIREDTNIRPIDMGCMNETPFLLRVSIGTMADMIIDADPHTKANFGQLAYSMAAIQKLSESSPVTYTIIADNKKYIETGVSLVIANSGNIGFSGVPFVPDIRVDDGYLDVLVLKKKDVPSLTAIIGEAVINRSLHESIAHWRVKKASISAKPEQRVLCDDIEFDSTRLDIEVLPKAILIAVPPI